MKAKENENFKKKCMSEKETICNNIQNSINADKIAKNESDEIKQISDEEVEEDVERINPDSETLDRG